MTLNLGSSQPSAVGGFLNDALQHTTGGATMSQARESSSHLSHPKSSVNSALAQISPREIVLSSGKGIWQFCQCWDILMSWRLVSKADNDT